MIGVTKKTSQQCLPKWRSLLGLVTLLEGVNNDLLYLSFIDHVLIYKRLVYNKKQKKNKYKIA